MPAYAPFPQILLSNVCSQKMMSLETLFYSVVEYNSVTQLKRWLQCRGLSSNGIRLTLTERRVFPVYVLYIKVSCHCRFHNKSEENCSRNRYYISIKVISSIEFKQSVRKNVLVKYLMIIETKRRHRSNRYAHVWQVVYFCFIGSGDVCCT